VTAAGPVVQELLASCAELRVVLTSRIVLRLPGEHELALGPLAEWDATELFLARVRSARPELELTLDTGCVVAGLVRDLDGLPLALGLAAARAKTLPIASLRERLADCLDALGGTTAHHPRQRSLLATLAWSHDLLDEPRRRLFRRLAAFSGGFTLEAVE